jgi:hypothetical protein
MNIQKVQSSDSVVFLAHKYYSSTGAFIEASGATKEEAKANLKEACFKYRQKPLKSKLDVNGKQESFTSPGYSTYYNEGTSVQHIYNPDRRGLIFEAND